MHVPDSADIGGGGLYTIGPPKSVIGRHILNALVQEALEVLNKAGITPRASGAADAAANYKGQLRDAIHRLGHAYKDFVSVPTDGTGLDTTFNPDALAYRLDPDGGGDTPFRHVLLPLSINSIFGSVANTHGYVILVVNNTPTIKCLEDSVRHINFAIGPGDAAFMFGWNDTGTRIVWNQFGGEAVNAQTSTHLYSVSDAANVGSYMVDSTYSLTRKHISIAVHQIEVSGLPGSGTSSFSCTPGPEVDLPAAISSHGVQRLISIGLGGGVYTFEVGKATLHDGGVLTIERLDGDGFNAGSNILIRPFEISCPLF